MVDDTFAWGSKGEQKRFLKRRHAKRAGRKPTDLSGKTFGLLMVVRKSEREVGRGQYIYDCKCSCGNELMVSARHLRSGNTRSCGCLRMLSSLLMSHSLTRDELGRWQSSPRGEP